MKKVFLILIGLAGALSATVAHACRIPMKADVEVIGKLVLADCIGCKPRVLAYGVVRGPVQQEYELDPTGIQITCYQRTEKDGAVGRFGLLKSEHGYTQLYFSEEPTRGKVQ